MDTQSVCASKHDWHPTVGGHWGQWSEESFFPAIIKQFNWICSYAGELLVWISISMLSHKSYFQVHWALSSAKLILHDMPWGWHSVFSIQRTSWQTPACRYRPQLLYTHRFHNLQHKAGVQTTNILYLGVLKSMFLELTLWEADTALFWLRQSTRVKLQLTKLVAAASREQKHNGSHSEIWHVKHGDIFYLTF